MPRLIRTGLVMVFLVVVSACGAASSGTGGNSKTGSVESPKFVLTAAVSRTTSESLHMKGTLNGTLKGTGDFASLGDQPFSITMNIAMASAAKMSGEMGLTILGQNLSIPVVLVNGTEYVSVDSGATWKSVPVSATAGSSLSAPLQYLESIGSVSDAGSGTVDGVAVEKYHGVLDPAKALAAIRSSLSQSLASNPRMANLVNAIQYQDGTFDVALNHQGQVVHETVTVDASIDGSSLGSGVSGTLGVHESADMAFSDYGATFEVTTPPNA